MYTETARNNLRTKADMLMAIDRRMTELTNDMAKCGRKSKEWHKINSTLSLLWAFKIKIIEC